MGRASRPRQGEVNARRGPETAQAPPFSHPEGPALLPLQPVPKHHSLQTSCGLAYRLDFPNFPPTQEVLRSVCLSAGLEGAPGGMDEVKSRYFAQALAEPGLPSSSPLRAQHVPKSVCADALLSEDKWAGWETQTSSNHHCTRGILVRGGGLVSPW